jgi:glycosyltransferase involved in cell wall biosynthesis
MKIQCSVGILTLNSGKYLERCLQSLEDFEDVFLLDGNSTDNTHEIAKRYGRLVYKQVETEEKNVKIQNFTEVRNKAIGLTKCDWLFFIDSDEFIEEKLRYEIALAVQGPVTTAYNVQKKYIIGYKKIEYCFNYPNYYTRLFNKKSGVGFKAKKVVHEQIHVPQGVTVVPLQGVVYSAYPETYRECVEKDKYYVALAKKNMFPEHGRQFPRWMCARNAVRYFLRAGNIFYKTLKTYLRYGYKNSLPFLHAWRHVRYHLIVSALCVKQVFV